MNRLAVRIAMLVESRIFPLAFAVLAVQGLLGILSPLPSPQLGKATLLEAGGVLVGFLANPDMMPAGLSRARILAMLAFGILHPVLGVVFNAACGVLLALRAELRYVPSKWREFLIPTAATFLLLLVSLSGHLPGWMTRPLTVPAPWAIPLLGLAAVLTLGGLAVALWGLAYLRRNFSVFVEVREIIANGPYRFVRHPLYIGEILMATGLCLSRPTLFGILVVLALSRLQWARTVMEEARLSAASPEYAERMHTTGRFFPRMGAAPPRV